ncbi:hypothetical protein E2C01_005255 [Portunus trituberculatus]|uniref:Uncharacterized protein n=1 Tax=Portunus trituberculatus TaxID=210409 RepID=A0A5B7CS17_PORTR|nr:hypothetical protein [Portunus trituberculatus]
MTHTSRHHHHHHYLRCARWAASLAVSCVGVMKGRSDDTTACRLIAASHTSTADTTFCTRPALTSPTPAPRRFMLRDAGKNVRLGQQKCSENGNAVLSEGTDRVSGGRGKGKKNPLICDGHEVLIHSQQVQNYQKKKKSFILKREHDERLNLRKNRHHISKHANTHL